MAYRTILYDGKVYLLHNSMIESGVITNVIDSRIYAIDVDSPNGMKTTVYRHHNLIHPNLDLFLLKMKRIVQYAEKTGRKISAGFSRPTAS